MVTTTIISATNHFLFEMIFDIFRVSKITSKSKVVYSFCCITWLCSQGSKGNFAGKKWLMHWRKKCTCICDLFVRFPLMNNLEMKRTYSGVLIFTLDFKSVFVKTLNCVIYLIALRCFFSGRHKLKFNFVEYN